MEPLDLITVIEEYLINAGLNREISVSTLIEKLLEDYNEED